jgi:hypothetical protein
MRMATLFRAGDGSGRAVSGWTIIGCLVIAGGLAVIFGSLAQLAALIVVGAGEGAVIIIFDWMVAPLWIVAFLILGYPATRLALRSGWFGPIRSILFGISIVWAASVAGLVAAEFPGAPVYGLHLALIYGSLAGLLFWSLLVSRVPALHPHGDERTMWRAICIYGMVLVAYLAALALLIISMEPG